jgi:hypothetical protein
MQKHDAAEQEKRVLQEKSDSQRINDRKFEGSSVKGPFNHLPEDPYTSLQIKTISSQNFAYGN